MNLAELIRALVLATTAAGLACGGAADGPRKDTAAGGAAGADPADATESGGASQGSPSGGDTGRPAGGGAADGPNPVPFESTLDDERTIASLDLEEVSGLCVEAHRYRFAFFSLEELCLVQAGLAVPPETNLEFRKQCVSDVRRCLADTDAEELAAAQQNLMERECEGTDVPNLFVSDGRENCELSLGDYEDCISALHAQMKKDIVPCDALDVDGLHRSSVYDVPECAPFAACR